MFWFKFLETCLYSSIPCGQFFVESWLSWLPYIDRIDQIRIKMNLIIILTIFEKSTAWRRYENSRLKTFKKYHETKTASKTRRCMKNLPSCRIYSGKSFRACSKRELYFFYLRFLLRQCEVYRKYYWDEFTMNARENKYCFIYFIKIYYNKVLLLP